jgi:uncharacterized membrane protein
LLSNFQNFWSKTFQNFGEMAGRQAVVGIIMGIVLNIALAFLSVSIGVEWVAARRPSLPAPNGRERNASGSRHEV